MDKCSALRTNEQKWSPQVESHLSLSREASQTAQLYLAKGSETSWILLRTQLVSFLVNQFVSSPYNVQHFDEFQLWQEAEGKKSNQSYWHLYSALSHQGILYACFWLREVCWWSGNWQLPDMGALDFQFMKVNSQEIPEWLGESCFTRHEKSLFLRHFDHFFLF